MFFKRIQHHCDEYYVNILLSLNTSFFLNTTVYINYKDNSSLVVEVINVVFAFNILVLVNTLYRQEAETYHYEIVHFIDYIFVEQ